MTANLNICPIKDMYVINGDLGISLGRRDDLNAIRSGAIACMGIKDAYAYRSVLYDWDALFAAFWGPEFNNVAVEDFRRKFRKGYPAVRFVYFAYPGDMGEACTMRSPKWEHAGDVIYLEWEAYDI